MLQGLVVFGYAAPQNWYIKAALKSNPHIGPVQELQGSDLEKGVWIGLLNCHKSPPHLVMIGQNMAYSLEHSQLKTYPCQKLFHLIERKQKPSIFFRLQDIDKHQIVEAFNAYRLLEEGQTCLNPIKDVLLQKGIEDVRACQYIFELIPLLDRLGMVSETKGYLVKLESKNEHFYFQVYSKKEIFERIEGLKKTN